VVVVAAAVVVVGAAVVVVTAAAVVAAAAVVGVVAVVVVTATMMMMVIMTVRRMFLTAFKQVTIFSNHTVRPVAVWSHLPFRVRCDVTVYICNAYTTIHYKKFLNFAVLSQTSHF